MNKQSWEPNVKKTREDWRNGSNFRGKMIKLADIREHAMEPPVATWWLPRHAVLVAPQMTRTTPKMSHRTFPGQPPDDVTLPNEGGATRYCMPREPPGGYWWLHRMFSIHPRYYGDHNRLENPPRSPNFGVANCYGATRDGGMRNPGEPVFLQSFRPMARSYARCSSTVGHYYLDLVEKHGVFIQATVDGTRKDQHSMFKLCRFIQQSKESSQRKYQEPEWKVGYLPIDERTSLYIPELSLQDAPAFNIPIESSWHLFTNYVGLDLKQIILLSKSQSYFNPAFLLHM
ncbi:hypothetical protein C8R45DRAFT_942339 [Mycena sanguinolenta]|nr:hypothetical protein C8R45DRAFT_942339 [Mycena sanguinolenta]